MSQENRLVTSTYRGTTAPEAHGRSLRNCEYNWQRSLIHYFRADDLITTQLEIAKAEGREIVTIADIGSGYAGLFSDILATPGSTPRTRDFLKQNPNIFIRMVGLTDARRPAEFGQPDPNFYYPLKDNDQFSAANIFYTLTSAQRLRTFLQSQDIPKVDLMLATASFQYLGFLTFRQTVEDGLVSLRGPGSRMLVSIYSYLTPGIIGLPDRGQARFTIPGENRDVFRPSIKDTLRDKGSRFKHTGSPAGFILEIAALKDTLRLFNRLGIIPDNTLASLTARIDSSLLRNAPDGYPALADIALTTAEKTLAKRWIDQTAEKKTAILLELAAKFSGDIRMDIKDTEPPGFNGFTAEKI